MEKKNSSCKDRVSAPATEWTEPTLDVALAEMGQADKATAAPAIEPEDEQR